MEILFSVNNYLKMYGGAFFEFSNFNELRKRGHRKVIHRMGGAFSLTNRYFVPRDYYTGPPRTPRTLKRVVGCPLIFSEFSQNYGFVGYPL